ncbi:hypothetical protein [Psychrobacter sp. I-STPA6b]|uniref:hypothetical protein n=1 Tax=Psychrobacter sp. I-STPA6b TaxID=2585718 RepID=UPI001D0C7EB9|nr:hypothetical protein [Psychrobacter sp. I-STPA6b]
MSGILTSLMVMQTVAGSSRSFRWNAGRHVSLHAISKADTSGRQDWLFIHLLLFYQLN